MSNVRLERRRTGWEIVFGALLMILGLIILGDAVVATTVPVLFIGWLAVIAGVAGSRLPCSRSAEGTSGPTRSPAVWSGCWG